MVDSLIPFEELFFMWAILWHCHCGLMGFQIGLVVRNICFWPFSSLLGVSFLLLKFFGYILSCDLQGKNLQII